jgi:hypothetical protein
MSAPWSGWSDGPSRGAMVLVMLEPVALAWILLLPVIAGSVFADAFDWLPVRRRWLQLTLVLGASVLVGILVIPCVLVAIGGSAAVGQIENKHFGLVLIGAATIAATVVPLIVMAWLAWQIDALPISRHAALPRRPHRPRLDGAHRRRSRHGHAARGNRGDPGDGGALPADGRRARGHDVPALPSLLTQTRCAIG